MSTHEHVAASLNVIRVVADAIRDLGEVPSGHLYARLMEFMTLEQYSMIVGTLKRVGLIEEKHNLLRWIGEK